MDTNGFLQWLKRSLSSSDQTTGRTILRFLRPEDDRQFLQTLLCERHHHPALAEIRRLDLIHAYSCPVPASGWPPPDSDAGNGEYGEHSDCGAPGDYSDYAGILWEEDSLVVMQASPKRAAAPARTPPKRSPRRTTNRLPARNAANQGIPWGVRHIRAPEAWSQTTGHQVKVGVIDTGVDFGHPDLSHSLERGINLLQRTLPPQDDNGHGTHIAGTIAAANRMQGMIGVAPRASIYPVKAFDYNGTAYVSDIILGIDWCVRNRMDVVNMSFGMSTRNKSLLTAVSSAHRAGVLIVASSGNDGKQDEIDFPARYGQTVAVGAINRIGQVASFTNRSEDIDIYAPGERVNSSWLQGGRRFMSGTSMATSHVTGAVALLLGLKPGLSPEQIKDVLRRSSRPLRKSSPRKAGELDVMRMLQAARRRS